MLSENADVIVMQTIFENFILQGNSVAYKLHSSIYIK